MNTLMDKLHKLQELNFQVVSAFSDGDVNKVENFIENIKNSCKAYGWPIDGIVFKYNNIKEYLAARRTDHHFKGGLAYKFYDDEDDTTSVDLDPSEYYTTDDIVIEGDDNDDEEDYDENFDEGEYEADLSDYDNVDIDNFNTIIKREKSTYENND